MTPFIFLEARPLYVPKIVIFQAQGGKVTSRVGNEMHVHAVCTQKEYRRKYMYGFFFVQRSCLELR